MKLRCIGLLTVLLLTACDSGIESTPPAKAELSPIPVETVTIVPTQTKGTLALYGLLEPMSSVSINVDFSAPIQAVLVEEGERVNVGQPLLRFDMAKVELKQRQLRHTLEQAESQFAKAERDLRRMQELKLSNSISQQQLDNAQAEFDSTRSSVSALESELALLHRDLARREIHSPVEGMVSHRNVDPNESTVAYTPLFELEVDASMKVSVFIGEKMLSLVQLGNTAIVKTVTGASKAKVISIASNSDITTGNYEVKLLLDNSLREYRAGMGAEVILDTTPLEGQLLLPESALVVDRGEHVVFLIKDSFAIRQPVKLKYGLNEKLHIASGLKSNDVVAIAGAEFLVDGSLVEVKVKHE
ncbi:efflux RND transporter periplasmic adaptor subunit [Photobacterium sp. OFAV2-7]|uniref:efflux RND transporter periplasmic adaptor subunit n=1 Tax=Photobacterium sp. OFAV2-7 TaxID=2917748 RepID=UPI001EF6402A|nr:efflux RND transporter periplasmic adaptor subunit [Photobacterium sp. OFAV2-7]MCG7584318.1 efflux RND transporter periplasmic adaptor subunit [Photobacterium sp. OFAV2-7]